MLLLTGTSGYYYFGEGKYALIDCLYMTVITITTIGYGEIVDLSKSPTGRVFNIMVAFSGMGILTYTLSTLTAYVIEGDLKNEFVRGKMEKKIKQLKGHYIVCGYGRVGRKISRELSSKNITFVVIELEEKIKGYFGDPILKYYIVGDATEEIVLEKASIKTAIGIFVATGDDNKNLVTTLTAKLLNTSVKVISRCEETIHLNKMLRAGADSVISPAHIGGLRMLTEMIKPHINSFIDHIFKQTDDQHIIESFEVKDRFDNKKLSDIKLYNFPETIVLALKKMDTGNIIFNPGRDMLMKKGDILIVITSLDEQTELGRILQS
ncbi:MAG: potassium channel protein [Candidatus Magnetoovum sp. WYHC-5]|nr:potassium channel protein [Candidatus Magnetoovum sp. WYHC-5]